MSYEAVIDALDLHVRVSEAVGDYQGDLCMVVRDGYPDYKYGYLVIGYGSCSGCDAWEACSTWQERMDLMRSILEETVWFDTLDEVKAHVALKAEERLTWYAHENGFKEFAEKVEALTW